MGDSWRQRAVAMDAAQRGAWLVRVFAAALALAAIALYVGPVQRLAVPEAAVEVPWLALAGGFLLAEVAVVHYDFRSETHSFSLSELPLVFGLLFVAPADLVTAHVAGAAVALVVHRRQKGVKLAFNLSEFALGTCLAVLTYAVVRDATPLPNADDWPAAMVAAVVSSAMATLAIFFAIALTEGRADVTRLPEQLTLALLATVGGASLALLGAEATARHRSAIVLLAVPVVTFLLAYRTYVRQRQDQGRLEFLYEAARILEAAPDLGSAMASLLQTTCRTFRAEVAQFALADADSRVLLVVATADEVRTAGFVDLAAVHPLLREGMALEQAEARDLQPPVAGPGGAVLHDIMLAPVGADTRASGVLLVGNRLGTGTFSPEELRLLQAMAAHADLSLANGRLAQMLGEATSYAARERRSSLELQRGLLPHRLPDRGDVALAVRYQPSGLGAEVGGDWYDVLELPSGALGVVIGDVIGHDLRSAARMAQARSALGAYATEGHGPAAVMERLNARMAQTDPDFMGTVCYAEVRPEESTVTFVLAGHPPPLLVPAGRPPLLVDVEPGLPLGVVEDAIYRETTVALPPGSALVLYTDGLVESRTASLTEGLARIAATPGISGSVGVEEIAYRLLASMPEGEAGDDVALLVLRNLGGNVAARTPLPRQAVRTGP